MNKKLLFRTLLVVMALLSQLNLWAQETKVTLNVETAGTLSSLIAGGQKNEIVDLTLTGDLNGDDIRFIREMAGMDAAGDKTEGALTKLNLADANIVAGGAGYHFETITTPNVIGSYMFFQTNLSSIVLPNSITGIGEGAMYGCANLTSVTIPSDVNNIEKNAFTDCINIREFKVSNENETYSSLEGVLFDKDTTVLVAYPNAKSDTYSIPNSVIEIKESAFESCASLIDIIIPNSVTKIGDNAFKGCACLASIIIPNGVTKIGSSVFTNCIGLENIVIPNGVTTIGSYAFRGCVSLESITIPNGVASIGSSAFRGCTGLKSITIPESVTTIGSYAFRDCTELTGVYCKSETPSTINANSFEKVDKDICKLYVPMGSMADYAAASGWSDFLNIIEKDFTSIGSVNNNNISIQSTSNGIVIETKEATTISIFNMSAQKVYQSVVNGYEEISLVKGVYIVNGNKVIVK
ncbi:hypothetical protein M2138_001514 [Dysgonomonadaceae bacterium PH5-43]|nr:hypothetical protein [Dysgonomonadaceae bacterium PH5-43]